MLKIYKSVIFKNYANFTGRARRKEFWIFFLVSGLLYFSLKSIFNLIFPACELFSEIYITAFLIPAIAVGVRRMHDINKSGWCFFAPFYNFYLCTVMGNEGENKYGSDPIDEMEYLRELGKDLN